MRSLVGLLVSFQLAFLCGCGEANPRQEVTGTVTLKGQPLDQGTIEFVPISNTNAGDPTTTGGAIITEGEYKIEAAAGLVPGKYKVLITSGDSQTPDNSDEVPGPSGNFVMKDRIPPKYNVNSKIEVEVTNTAPNKFDYEIP